MSKPIDPLNSFPALPPVDAFDEQYDMQAYDAASSVSVLQQHAHRIAVEHGFNDATFGERIALIHSELSEALECYREEGDVPGGLIWFGDDGKPEGIPFELADVIIRILDMAEAAGYDMGRAVVEKMAYNERRTHRHGGKHL